MPPTVGIKALRKIELGAEVAPGTLVACTTVWRGTGALADPSPVEFVEEDIGIAIGTDRAYTPFTEGEITLEDTPATFEQFPLLLASSIEDVAGVADGAGTGFVYTYPIPTISLPGIADLLALSVRAGDNVEVESMAYGHVPGWTLTGASKEAMMMGATIRGHRPVAGAAFSGASVPTVDEALFQRSTFFVDAIGGAFGGTQVSDTLLGAEVSYEDALAEVWTADDDLNFSFVKGVMPTITLSVTMEWNASSVAEKANFRNRTSRKIRLNVNGPALTTPAAETNKRITIDLVGKWTAFEAIGKQEGNDIVTATFQGRYNAADATAGEIVVVNELASLL